LESGCRLSNESLAALRREWNVTIE
jgi:hypothetical protein